MSDAVTSSMGIVAYLTLFATVGLLFVLVALVLGRFLRPSNPIEEKLETYECGEPAVGSSFVQFDLRFYVVALLFIIFDVEVAFFFPWATVFGKATHLADASDRNPVVERVEGKLQLTDQAAQVYRELGVRKVDKLAVPSRIPASLQQEIDPHTDPEQRADEIIKKGASQLVVVTLVDMILFFAVLMVGFAYVWKRGDLDWVRVYRRGQQGAASAADAIDQLDLDQALAR